MLAACICPDQAEAPVGKLGAGGPDLLAIDQKMVAFVLGPGLQGGQVRTRAGLRIALAPAQFAPDDGGDVRLLLFLGPVLKQGRAEHHHAHSANGIPGAEASHFLPQDSGVRRRQPAAAIGRWPGGDTPARLAHARLPEGIVPFHGHRRLGSRYVLAVLQGGREVGLEPGAGLGPEVGVVLSPEVRHANLLPQPVATPPSLQA
jgi:hypothetical protein